MGSEPLSDEILRRNHALFQEMVTHRFVQDIIRGRLPAAVFDRYLVYEGAFVETAIAILGYAVAKAETVQQKAWLAGARDALVRDQIPYFQQAYAVRNIDPAAIALDVPQVEGFRAGMLDIAATGTFIDIVTAMFAAEWMYWTWSKNAACYPIGDPMLKRWVEMHVSNEFATQALRLRQEVDAAGEHLPTERRVYLAAVFAKAMALEIAFHDAPYRGSTPD